MSSGPPSPPAFTPGKVLVGAAFTVGALIAGAAWSRRSRWGLALGVGIAVVSGRKFLQQLREDPVAPATEVEAEVVPSPSPVSVPMPAPVPIAEVAVEETVVTFAALPAFSEPETAPEVLAPSPDYQRSGATPVSPAAPAPEATTASAPASFLPLAESLLPLPPPSPAFPPAPSAPAPMFAPQPLFQEASQAPTTPEATAPAVAAFLAQEALVPDSSQPAAWDAAQHPHAPLIWESRDTGSRSSEGPGETVWFGLHEVTLETLLPSSPAPAPSGPSHGQGEVALEADMDAPVAVGLDMAALIQALNPPSLGSTVMGEHSYTGLETPGEPPAGTQENYHPAPDSFLLDPEPATAGISQKP